MNRRLYAMLAAMAILASGCGLSLQTLPQLGGGVGGGYTIHAVFSTVSSLAPNAKVRDGDAVVGRVTGIHARNFQAVIDMSIERGLRLPVGTTAQARFSTPLGDEYIALTVPAGDPARSAALRPGATLGLPQTSAAPTVADTLAALATILYGSGLGQAETVTSELNQVLAGRGPEIKKLLGDVDTTLTSLAGNDTGIDAALASLGQISGQIDGGRGSLVAALDTLPQAADILSDNNAALVRLLDSINRLTPATLAVIDRSGADLVTDSQQLAPVAEQLAMIQGQVGTDLGDLQRVVKDAGRVAPAGYLQGYFSFDTAYPSVGCDSHLVPASNPVACNPLYPSSNVAPQSRLSTSSSPATSSSGGQASGALAEMGAALP